MIKKIVLLMLFLSFFIIPTYNSVYAITVEVNKGGNTTNVGKKVQNRTDLKSGEEGRINERLSDIGDHKNFFNSINEYGEAGIKGLIFNLARDLRVVVFFLSSIIIIVILIRLVFGDNTEEGATKLKKGILWISIGVIVFQTAYVAYDVVYGVKNVDENLARKFVSSLIEPFIRLLQLLIMFIFLFMGILMFYKLVTANGDESKLAEFKKALLYLCAGFVMTIVSREVIKRTYNPGCSGGEVVKYGMKVCENVTSNTQIIISILNWINSFLILIMIIMIIYAGFLIFTSEGEQEKMDKAKKIILYNMIGLALIFGIYIIIRFLLVSPINTNGL